MQLNLTIDYAIRTLLFLASRNQQIPAAEISGKLGIKTTYILTFTRKLRDAKIIASAPGAHGGLRLARDPSEITLLEVVELMEGTTRINRCLDDDYYYHLGEEECSVREVYQSLQDDFEAKLRQITIEDLMDKRK